MLWETTWKEIRIILINHQSTRIPWICKGQEIKICPIKDYHGRQEKIEILAILNMRDSKMSLLSSQKLMHLLINLRVVMQDQESQDRSQDQELTHDLGLETKGKWVQICQGLNLEQDLFRSRVVQNSQYTPNNRLMSLRRLFTDQLQNPECSNLQPLPNCLTRNLQDLTQELLPLSKKKKKSLSAFWKLSLTENTPRK